MPDEDGDKGGPRNYQEVKASQFFVDKLASIPLQSVKGIVPRASDVLSDVEIGHFETKVRT